MAQGDHIYCQANRIGHSIIYHHGIDCGNQTVIHYQKNYKNENCGIIRWVSFNEFAKGNKIYTEPYDLCDQSLIVIARAKRRLGEKRYNFFYNNCEHFARYCKTGQHTSSQVDKANSIIGDNGIAILNNLNHCRNHSISCIKSTTNTTKNYINMLINSNKNNENDNDLPYII
ncbi:lecithin retinol acyltransferase family protein [Nostoc sp. CCY0012]|uniref:lecithin retinol acyltransferase family protein n=1 Tax=Nostoc sp. CCY0012 TaxID=1056123 RepID=UPI0039C692A5